MFGFKICTQSWLCFTFFSTAMCSSNNPAFIDNSSATGAAKMTEHFQSHSGSRWPLMRWSHYSTSYFCTHITAWPCYGVACTSVCSICIILKRNARIYRNDMIPFFRLSELLSGVNFFHIFSWDSWSMKPMKFFNSEQEYFLKKHVQGI